MYDKPHLGKGNGGGKSGSCGILGAVNRGFTLLHNMSVATSKSIGDHSRVIMDLRCRVNMLKICIIMI